MVEELLLGYGNSYSKADEGVDGYADFEQALPQFTMGNAKI